MKLIFAGTPEFARKALEAIHAAGHSISLVLTQPDRPAGRGMQLQSSPVKQFAQQHGLEVLQPVNLKTEESRQAIREACANGAQVMVVAAYGLLLPQAVLDMPRFGCLNIHGSLLPRWRGAAPIHRAIEAGDVQTGITIMQMEAGLDTGPMLRWESESILATDTTASLHDRLALLGANMMVEALAQIDQQGALPAATRQPQGKDAPGVTYAHKIDKLEAKAQWTRPAIELERQIRAFDPFPGLSAAFGAEVLKCWKSKVIDDASLSDADRALPAGAVLSLTSEGLIICCGKGALCITQVQRPGARRQTIAQALAGLTAMQLMRGTVLA